MAPTKHSNSTAYATLHLGDRSSEVQDEPLDSAQIAAAGVACILHALG